MALTTLQIITLKNISGVGVKSILKVGDSVNKISSTEEFISTLKKCKIKKKDSISSSKVDISQHDLETAERQALKLIEENKSDGIEILTYYESIFPQILRETKDESGKKSAPPVILYYKGDVEILKLPSIAVIGSRVVTSQGEKAGIYLAEQFAKRGFSITSGLAIGCDTCAHRGALNVGGKTIAFLAHGLDTVYPPQNKELADEIVKKGGLILSEYSKGFKTNRYSLVERDRLQAGLGLATIVIQTGEKGGTMHAANATINSEKPLYVVSYSDKETNIHEQTLGNHLLVSKGAKKISGTDDLDKISYEILNSPINKVIKKQNSLI